MNLHERLAELCEEHNVPGATLGILHDGRVETYGTGVCSTENGIEVLPDTLFQIGSITKVYTTTLLMELVEEGELDLDGSVRTYLPDFALSDDETTNAVTVRHLLTHTSGIADLDFGLFGRGDDCIELFVEALAGQPMLHEPGRFCSYCNSGFVVAGRIVEVLRKATWDEVLRERLVEPLGMSRTVTLAEEAIKHRAATGHEMRADGSQHVAAFWGIPRSAGPAGLVVSTAADVLRFAKFHIENESVRVMQEPQTSLPRAPDAHRGLGWHLYDWSGSSGTAPVVGHDGGTFGQLAFLRVCPSRNFAAVLLTNGFGGVMVHRHLFDELVAELLELTIPPEPTKPDETVAIDVARYTGRWVWQGMTVDITETADDGWGEGTISAKLAIPADGDAPVPEIPPIPMHAMSDTEFLVRVPPLGLDSVCVFTEPGDDNAFAFADLRGRLMKRAPDEQT